MSINNNIGAKASMVIEKSKNSLLDNQKTLYNEAIELFETSTKLAELCKEYSKKPLVSFSFNPMNFDSIINQNAMVVQLLKSQLDNLTVDNLKPFEELYEIVGKAGEMSKNLLDVYSEISACDLGMQFQQAFSDFTTPKKVDEKK